MRAGYVESGPDERVYGTSIAWWESPATGQNLGLASAGNSMERKIAQLLDGLKRFQFQLFWDLGFPYFAISLFSDWESESEKASAVCLGVGHG